MDSKLLRIRAVRQALARRACTRSTPTVPELQLLTAYVLGQRTLTETCQLLQDQGDLVLTCYPGGNQENA